MAGILKKGIRPGAVMASADPIIWGAIKAALDHGLNIPDDISFVGYNNDYLSCFIYPSLTSVNQPKMAMGRIAMQLLIDIMEGRKPKNRQILLKTRLIERDTVRIRK